MKWKEMFGSRCAVDSCHDWLNEDITHIELFNIVSKLGFKTQASSIRRYKKSNLQKNMRQALKRNGE